MKLPPLFAVIVASLATSAPILTAANGPEGPRGIAVASYDPAQQQLRVMYSDGAIVYHEQVPKTLYDELLAKDLDGAFYEAEIFKAYPPVEPDPDGVLEMGPVDNAYVDALKEPPPEVLESATKALLEAISSGAKAMSEVERYAGRTQREYDPQGEHISSAVKENLLRIRSLVNQSKQRMNRKEYHLASDLIRTAVRAGDELMQSFAPTIPNASSVSIREQHQASHFISVFNREVEEASLALDSLRKAVEPVDTAPALAAPKSP